MVCIDQRCDMHCFSAVCVRLQSHVRSVELENTKLSAELQMLKAIELNREVTIAQYQEELHRLRTERGAHSTDAVRDRHHLHLIVYLETIRDETISKSYCAIIPRYNVHGMIFIFKSYKTGHKHLFFIL